MCRYVDDTVDLLGLSRVKYGRVAQGLDCAEPMCNVPINPPICTNIKWVGTGSSAIRGIHYMVELYLLL